MFQVVLHQSCSANVGLGSKKTQIFPKFHLKIIFGMPQLGNVVINDPESESSQLDQLGLLAR